MTCAYMGLIILQGARMCAASKGSSGQQRRWDALQQLPEAPGALVIFWRHWRPSTGTACFRCCSRCAMHCRCIVRCGRLAQWIGTCIAYPKSISCKCDQDSTQAQQHGAGTQPQVRSAMTTQYTGKQHIPTGLNLSISSGPHSVLATAGTSRQLGMPARRHTTRACIVDMHSILLSRALEIHTICKL